jgi:hypothetical protein
MSAASVAAWRFCGLGARVERLGFQGVELSVSRAGCSFERVRFVDANIAPRGQSLSAIHGRWDISNEE